jgi:hypothetical protein
MPIELSNIIFTNQDDIVPLSGVEEIVNTGSANTFAGNDIITGTATPDSNNQGVFNSGTLNTGDGNDIITGISAGNGVGILHSGYMDTGDGNDLIIGISFGNADGFISYEGTTIDTGNGDDKITGIADVIGFGNGATLNTGNGNDSLSSQGNFINVAWIFLGDGNDSIIVETENSGGLMNSSTSIEGGGIIDTGNGNDVIITEGMGNDGIINTGNGDDSIIVNRDISYNIGTINTGNGNDSIIGDTGFNSFPFSSSRGSVFLGNGEDYIRTFGSNDFYGGKGNDILELTSGSYTIEILETTVNFIKDSSIMKTSEFEKLIAGNTTYNFSSLTNGQTIFVA